MMMNRLIKSCLLIALMMTATAAYSEKVTSVDITNNALKCTDCIDWKISGMCFFLKCTPFGCSIKTSIRVSHNIPDLVASAYTNRSSWQETAGWNPVKNSGTLSRYNKGQKGDTQLDFKRTDIIGNPALLAFDQASSTGYFCPSNTQPLRPYFLSELDPAWSSPDIERLYPQSWLGIPAIQSNSSLGVFGGQWAQVYPRTGWGAHPTDVVNGAVAAHRASHLTSRKSQPHIYTPADGGCGPGVKCWPPGQLETNENKGRNGYLFQMVSPKEDNTAEALGGNAVDWIKGRSSLDEQYVWNVWRRYSCCKKRGIYLYSITYDD